MNTMPDMLIQNVPKEVRDQFKGVCGFMAKTMRERLIELMQEDIDQFRSITGAIESGISTVARKRRRRKT